MVAAAIFGFILCIFEKLYCVSILCIFELLCIFEIVYLSKIKIHLI